MNRLGTNGIRNLILWAIVITIAFFLFNNFFSGSKDAEVKPISDVIAMAKRGDIASIEVKGDSLLVTTTKDAGGSTFKSYKESSASLLEMLDKAGVTTGDEGVQVKIVEESRTNWGSVLLNFLPLLLFAGFIFLMFRNAQGANTQAMNFGRSKARMVTANKPTTTFADVAGVEEAKQELYEIVEFLKSPQKFSSLGARIPRGVLLIGPPGTGKTLLGKAVAGEAGVPFFSISGSEFVEMFVGVGASRVRDLFDQAKRNAPCIVFVDELDAVGRHRGAGLGGSHDEREQTLNQILVEMDGFDSNTNIIVLAATNRPDILDPALLRPGRFDRQVVLDRPDIIGRKAILAVHTKGKPVAEDVDLEKIAKQTAGFSGADLANLVNEAAILAARREKKTIGTIELEEAIDRVIAGPERKSRVISQKEKELTAYHEAGHVLVSKLLPNANPPHKVTIIPRGMMGGYTRQLTEDRLYITRSQCIDEIAVLLSGHKAEEIVFGETSSGSGHDIEQATKLARKMVTEWGMSEKLGPRAFGRKEELVFLGKDIAEQRNFSERIALEIDKEVDSIIQEAHDKSAEVLTKNKARLDLLASRLIAEETLDGQKLEEIFSSPLPESKSEALKVS